MIILGIGISFLLSSLQIGGHVVHHPLYDFIASILITIIVWEGNLIIDTKLNSKFAWDKVPVKRVFVQLPISLIYSTTIMYFSMLAFNKYICVFPESTKSLFVLVASIIGVLISISILSIEIGAQFFSNWKKTLVEIEKYKAESLQAQLQNLKDQINPHFLFNNMSVLSSLVYKDQDKAVDFINQLSKVYRYLLDNRSSELVSLKDELIFIESYMYLLKIRFDTNLIFEMDIEPEKESSLLPPMAIQLLIENAIKHNEVSTQLPLTIRLKTHHNYLEVSNNLQLRTTTENSSKTGLKNIGDRYTFFTEQMIQVNETAKQFMVKIPLLQSK